MMKLKLISTFLIVFFIGLLHAQKPQNVHTAESPRGTAPHILRAGCDAGTVTPSLHIVSNSTNVEFLCWNDSLTITHDMNSDLSCDPNPATQAGIGYIFYSCIPTINGPDLATVQMDPCLVNTPPPANDIWIAADDSDASGSTNFWNGNVVNPTTSLQDFFNGGAPLELWFAPATVDDFFNATGPTYENDGMGGPAGPCVAVTVSDAFRVVYLNEIQNGAVTESSNNGQCEGTFRVTGGLPEFDNSNYTDIRVSLLGSPGVTGTVLGGPYTHGDMVSFSVPQPGMYNIIVQDGVSCESFSMANMACIAPVGLSFPPMQMVDIGDSICVDVTVTNWDSILAIQFSLLFDESILRLDTIVETNLPTIISDFGLPPTNGRIPYLGIADDDLFGYSLADGTVLFRMCFTAVGNGCSAITFTDDPLEILFGRPGPGGSINDNIGFDPDNGKIQVGPIGALVVIDTTIQDVSCQDAFDPDPNNPPDPNRDGSITLTVTGGIAPYTFDLSNGSSEMTSGTYTFDELPCGNYQVTITDSATPVADQIVETYSVGCPATPASFSYSGQQMVSCHPMSASPQTCDGAATVMVTGGVSVSGDYTITWETNGLTNVSNTSTNMNLCAGWNIVRAQDDNGCIFRDSVLIDSPPPVDIMVDNVVDPLCNGDDNGEITVSGSGGTVAIAGAYAYDWDHGPQTATATMLTEGMYFVTVRDDNMCFDTMTINLVEADPLLAPVDVNSTTDSVRCNGGGNGFIAINASGGNSGAFTFEWSHNPNLVTATASNLQAGLYTVTVTDSRGCSVITNHQIFEPTTLNAVIPDPVDPECFGQNTFINVTSVTGGNGGPYSFSVDNGALVPITDSIPVIAGPHLVTVFDNNLCEFQVQKNVNDGAQVQVDLGPDITIELGDNDIIRGFVNSSGGNTIIDAQWSSDIPSTFVCRDTSALCLDIIVDPVDNTVFTLTVTDDKGCVGSDEILVEVDNKRNVFIPNVFTPNGDGRNDVFRVFTGLGVQQINYFRIFDRWGDLLYEVENLPPSNNDDDSMGWTGEYKGKDMNSGVYVYLLEVQFIDGRTLLYRGDVTLLR